MSGLDLSSSDAPGNLLADSSQQLPVAERFQVNSCTGGTSFSIPIPITKGRGGFGPDLSLVYQSAAASTNGSFGSGWQLGGLQTISRLTSRGVPVYDDEVDVFVHSGFGELIPVDGSHDLYDEKDVTDYIISRYRPRIAQGLVRIEHWKNRENPHDAFWKTISGDNVTVRFGKDEESRIFDPDEPLRIFSWLVAETYDGNGNNMIFSYRKEDIKGAPSHFLDPTSRSQAMRYLKSVRYGNEMPNRDLQTWEVLGKESTEKQKWLFELVLDYGEHDEDTPTTVTTEEWKARWDPFTTYSCGFAINTFRLCRRFLMFHHFPDKLARQDCLVKSLVLNYEVDSRSGTSLLTSCFVGGHSPQGSHDLRSLWLPPVTLQYTKPPNEGEVNVEEVDVPVTGLGSSVTAQWIDLDGEGLPGVLAKVPGADWYYYRNQSDGLKVSLEGPGIVPAKPSLDGSGTEGIWADLEGDGLLRLISRSPDGEVQGFYERCQDGEFTSFIPFASYPSVSGDRWMTQVDLVGDGHSDLIDMGAISDGEFNWYPSLGKKGYGSVQRTQHAPILDGERRDTFFICDMVGDGLGDVVIIRYGSVRYWPNMGHGRFGRPVDMSSAPVEADFSPQRLRLANVSGVGGADLIYLRPGGGAAVYYNQFGIQWSDPYIIPTVPPLDRFSWVDVFDIAGRGSPALCWASDLPSQGMAEVHFLDLTAGSRPGLVRKMENGTGLEVELEYRSSTLYRLEDERAGQPWVTRLPFPVLCVSQVTTRDTVARTSVESRFDYYNGYYDPVDREFRGFQRVDKVDREVTGTIASPPVLTKTWYFTGLGPLDAVVTPPASFPSHNLGLLDPLISAEMPPKLHWQDLREAYVSLSGLVRCTEIFNLDKTTKENVPYQCEQQSYEVVMEQSSKANEASRGSFRVNGREIVTAVYERSDAKSPKITHQLVLETDRHGNVCQVVEINYARTDSTDQVDRVGSNEDILTYSNASFTNAVEEANKIRAPLISENRQYRLFPDQKSKPTLGSRYKRESLRKICRQLPKVKDRPPTKNGCCVLVSSARVLYTAEDLLRPLPLGQLHAFSVQYQGYQLALTDLMLQKHLDPFNDHIARTNVLKDGGYAELDAGSNEWWVPSVRQMYGDKEEDALNFARSHFYTPSGEIDAFGAISRIEMDEVCLLPQLLTDAVGNRTTISHEYVHMMPHVITDANNNCSETLVDPLGRCVAVGVGGKGGSETGNSVSELELIVSDEYLDLLLKDPSGPLGAEALGHASHRIVYSMGRPCRPDSDDATRPTPVRPTAQLEFLRNRHVNDPIPTDIHIQITYLDGSGQSIQKLKLVNQSEKGATWQLCDWAICNQAGQPVEVFQPCHVSSPAFCKIDMHPDTEIRQYSTTTFYDAMSRVVGVLHPDHTWSKTVYEAWKQIDYDVGDLIAVENPLKDEDIGCFLQEISEDKYLPTWYQQKHLSMISEDRNAGEKALVYRDTPSITHFDVLGRPTLSEQVMDRSESSSRRAWVEYDIYGNPCAEIDGMDRIVIKSEFDLLGRPLLQLSMDRGARWVFPDCAGQPLVSWDEQGRRQSHHYDKLRRLTKVTLQTSKPYATSEIVLMRNIYGESQPQGAEKNLLGRVYRCFDQSGLRTNQCYDLAGNCTLSTVQYATEYKQMLDWGAEESPQLEPRIYTTETFFNALGQNIHVVAPGGDSLKRSFDLAGRLAKVEAYASDSSVIATASIDHVTYEPDDQVGSILYGNGALVKNTYGISDRRLLKSRTTSTEDGRVLQDISSWYDCMGRLVRREDKAQQTLFFDNCRISPTEDFTYDSLGQLVESRGREQVDKSPDGPGRISPPDFHLGRSTNFPGDGKQMAPYVERYTYDVCGNILRMEHGLQSGSGWTRRYKYEEPSHIDPNVHNNRLSSSTVGNSTTHYGYDGISGIGGCITSMSGYSDIRWDHHDRLRAFATQRVTEGALPEMTWHVYNSDGERVRKVTERSSYYNDVGGGVKRCETLYLPFMDNYMVYEGNGRVICHRINTFHVRASELSEGAAALVEQDSRRQSHLVRYQIGDRLELDDKARVVSYEEFTAYGVSTYSAKTKGAAPRKYRFASYERDQESGLYLCGERYYACWLGRWLSPDPLGTADGHNLFCYVGNDPVNSSDHTGTMAKPKTGNPRPNTTSKDSGKRGNETPDKSQQPTTSKNTGEGKGVVTLYRGTARDRAERFLKGEWNSIVSYDREGNGQYEFRPGDLSTVEDAATYWTNERSRAAEHAGYVADGVIIEIQVPQEWVNAAVAGTINDDKGRRQLKIIDYRIWATGKEGSAEVLATILLNRLATTPGIFEGVLGAIGKSLDAWSVLKNVWEHSDADVYISREANIATDKINFPWEPASRNTTNITYPTNAKDVLKPLIGAAVEGIKSIKEKMLDSSLQYCFRGESVIKAFTARFAPQAKILNRVGNTWK
ncbi:RHS repeat-associated core domain protein [Fusarium tjaetaba]|uniref:RHS repeat-associated core domain protein n=1 Tax=Fusarium tjaetaba TaxID=1567544 RepID=A0A8H5SEA0_9HYPO|nr:RHS repeat-associated core domain protein [Fusarium tjaetaba]KAF5649455.1 RHS repeat-associated core domain protein [Fusarium tjaetaba]